MCKINFPPFQVLETERFTLRQLTLKDDNEIPSILLERENGKCKMYDAERKECLIYNSRPIICSAYPLKWDGNHYLIRDENCPGLDNGVMTQEGLEE
ncbi:MAG: YkgJ family cysteine cluster protein, partial [Nostocales cyanobacterium W4_Combined_metabat2_030]|nr:YkgJ family cysteine cluster protein [Nostocales cyanobacterium W4_Combined_metabat2_030]